MISKLKKYYFNNEIIFSDYFWRALQIIGKHGITFLIFIISAKLLSPYDFGVYNYIIAFVFFLILFGDFGISASASKFSTEYNLKDKDKLRCILFNCGLMIFLLTAIMVFLTIIIGPSYLKDKYVFVLYVLPLIFLAPMTSLYDGVYRGLKKFKQLALISIAVGFVSVFFVFYFIKSFGLIGSLISQDIFYLILLLCLGIGHNEFHFKFNNEVIREIGKYSIVIGVSGLSYFMFTRINVLILGYFNLILEIGYYEIINKIIMILLIPFTIFTQVISPNITEMCTLGLCRKIFSKYQKYLLISFISGLFLSLAAISCLPFLIKFFLPEYFNFKLIYSISILSILVTTQAISTVASLGFSTPNGDAKVNMYFLLCFGILNIPISILLVTNYGFFGIIFSTLIIKGMADMLFVFYYYQILKNEK